MVKASVLTLKFVYKYAQLGSFLSSVPEGRNVYRTMAPNTLAAPKERNVPQMISLLRSFILLWTLRFYKH